MTPQTQPDSVDPLIASQILVQLLQNNLNTLVNSLAVAQAKVAKFEKEQADRNTAVVPANVVNKPSAKVNN